MFVSGGGHGTGALIPLAISPMFLPWPGVYLAFAFWSALGCLSTLRPNRKRSMILAVLVAFHAIGVIAASMLLGSEYGSITHAFAEYPSLSIPFFLSYGTAMLWIISAIFRGFVVGIPDKTTVEEEEPPYILWAKRKPVMIGESNEDGETDD